MRADEGDLDLGIAVLNGLSDADIALEAGSAGEQDQEFVVLGDAYGFLGGDVMGRSVKQTRPLDHAGRVGEPDGVPIGFDFARSGPARARASIKIFKGGWIQKQCF